MIKEEDLIPGKFLLSKSGRIHLILKRIYETGYGNPLIVVIDYPPNVPQKLSLDSVQKYTIVDKDENPELFL